MHAHPRITLAFAALALCLHAARAHAIEEFPRDIKNKLRLSYEPGCNLCHAKANTGVGTATTPFALSMRAAGLDAEDWASLGEALTSLEDDGVDSDGDGVIDVDELRQDTSPNSPATTSFSKTGDPRWGCSVGAAAHTAAPASPHGALALGGLLALGLVARVRKRNLRARQALARGALGPMF